METDFTSSPSVLCLSAGVGASAPSADFVEQILAAARCVAPRVALHLRAEFVAQAPGYIFTVLDRYKPDTPFPCWCRCVLRNLAVSEWRKQQCEAKRLELWNRRRDHYSLPTVPAEEFLGARDLATIQTWTGRDRLLLLSMGGLWGCVPAPVQEKWLAAGNVSGPFPPDGFEESDSDSVRLALLADALRFSLAAAKQCWYRKRSVLEQLDVVQLALGVDPSPSRGRVRS